MKNIANSNRATSPRNKIVYKSITKTQFTTSKSILILMFLVLLFVLFEVSNYLLNLNKQYLHYLSSQMLPKKPKKKSRKQPPHLFTSKFVYIVDKWLFYDFIWLNKLFLTPVF